MTRSPASLVFSAALLVATSASDAGDGVLYGPTPYLCSDDSPFDLSGVPATFVLEDFEDGELDAPGVSADAGGVLGPGSSTDSVDCDDGVIDGSGVSGSSYFGSGPQGFLFTFDAAVLGGYPTHAGVVWTDGATFNQVIFEAFAPGGRSLGIISVDGVGDGNFGGGTDEDRFFGAMHDEGIGSIRIISNPQGGGGGIEVDHLQYGPVSICTADVTGDGTVDVQDLVEVVLNWGGTGAADVNGDGTVDVQDLVDVVLAWGSCA